MSVTVAAIVVNFGQTALSIRCLRSLKETTAQAALRIVLVDNASRDDPTAAVLHAVADAEIIRATSNGGYASGCNAGAGHAVRSGADYLFFLNNDALVERETVARLLAAARTYPHAILAPKIVYSDAPDRVWWAGGELRRPWMENRHIGQGEPSEAHMADQAVDWATGCALFVSADTYRRLGPLDESYFLYLEDVDWSVRAEGRGIQTRLVAGAVVRHDVSRSTGQLPAPHVLYYGCRNTYRLALRHNSWRARMLVAGDLAFSLAKVAARNAFSSAHRRDPLYRARTRALMDAALGRSGPLGANQ